MKSTPIIFLSIVLSILKINAQEGLKIGIQVGGTYNHFNYRSSGNESTAGGVGYKAGLAFSYGFSKSFAMIFQPGYIAKIVKNNWDANSSLHYIELPVGAKIRSSDLGNKSYIGFIVAPSLDILLKAKQETRGQVVDNNPIMRNVVLSLKIGVPLEKESDWGMYSFTPSFNMGITNALKDNALDNLVGPVEGFIRTYYLSLDFLYFF